ncbi:EAL domain-containing protein [Stappia sp. GBMRC 2046]|uniref:EAL domain-containing protein n=1 Tax=Stappia sediminis TaxID=2692190 RepID=A0A7X3S889_9HYPH|nr:EAL domain-containing protein [Stappia sediminis]MXN65608.1 EAL domain-containing protein [Stappia sediminis]
MKKRVALRSLAACVGLLAAVIWLEAAGFLRPLDAFLAENRFKYSSRAPSGDIAFIDIDARSLQEIGVWPWPRRFYADLIARLDKMQVAEIAFDIDFSTRSDPENDAVFAKSIADAGSTIVLAAFQQKASGNELDHALVFNRPIPELEEHAWLAEVNVSLEPDGRVWKGHFGRKIDGEPVPSMAAFLAGNSLSLGPDFTIDFGIDPAAIDRVSFVDVVGGKVPAVRLAGKRVVVGASALELRDLFPVPVHGILPGSLLQVLAAESISQQRTLHDTGLLPQLAALVLAAGLLLAIRRQPLRSRLSAIAILAIGIEAGAAALQRYYPFSVSTSAWLTGLGLLAFYLVFREFGIKRLRLLAAQLQTRNTRTVLNRVIEDNSAGILVVDRRETIITASNAAIGILAVSDRKLSGKHIADALPEGLADAVRQCLRSPDAGSMSGEVTLQHPGGERRVLEYVATPSTLAEIADTRTQRNHIACLTFNDVTEKRLAEDRLKYLARFDPVSGAMTRSAFLEAVATSGRSPAGSPPLGLALFAVELDGFETTGATLGHIYTDLLVAAAARRLKDNVPGGELSHLGAGTFALFAPSNDGAEAADRLAGEIIDCLSTIFDLKGNHVLVGANVGVTFSAADEADADVMLRQGQAALSKAKRAGINRWAKFKPGMEFEFIRRRMLELDLRRAIDREELSLVYQPQFALADGSLAGVEALMRWDHPHLGMIPPTEFIAIAEECGLVEEIGRWSIRRACEDAAGWSAPLRLAVNISPPQFQDPHLLREIRDTLARTGFPAERLDLEITESLFLESSRKLLQTMGELRDMGIGLVLDDFGTGYASLGYVARFPIAKIKIDKIFIDPITEDRKSAAIVRTIAELARELGMSTVAEGIETPEQRMAVEAAGVGIAQGYLFARPRPAREIAAEFDTQVARARA